ncbi:hypothetical protein MT418_008303 [Batrachochytrium dendrobatidis]
MQPHTKTESTTDSMNKPTGSSQSESIKDSRSAGHNTTAGTAAAEQLLSGRMPHPMSGKNRNGYGNRGQSSFYQNSNSNYRSNNGRFYKSDYSTRPPVRPHFDYPSMSSTQNSSDAAAMTSASSDKQCGWSAVLLPDDSQRFAPDRFKNSTYKPSRHQSTHDTAHGNTLEKQKPLNILPHPRNNINKRNSSSAVVQQKQNEKPLANSTGIPVSKQQRVQSIVAATESGTPPTLVKTLSQSKFQVGEMKVTLTRQSSASGSVSVDPKPQLAESTVISNGGYQQHPKQYGPAKYNKHGKLAHKQGINASSFNASSGASTAKIHHKVHPNDSLVSASIPEHSVPKTGYVKREAVDDGNTFSAANDTVAEVVQEFPVDDEMQACLTKQQRKTETNTQKKRTNKDKSRQKRSSPVSSVSDSTTGTNEPDAVSISVVEKGISSLRVDRTIESVSSTQLVSESVGSQQTELKTGISHPISNGTTVNSTIANTVSNAMVAAPTSSESLGSQLESGTDNIHQRAAVDAPEFVPMSAPTTAWAITTSDLIQPIASPYHPYHQSYFPYPIAPGYPYSSYGQFGAPFIMDPNANATNTSGAHASASSQATDDGTTNVSLVSAAVPMQLQQIMTPNGMVMYALPSGMMMGPEYPYMPIFYPPQQIPGQHGQHGHHYPQSMTHANVTPAATEPNSSQSHMASNTNSMQPIQQQQQYMTPIIPGISPYMYPIPPAQFMTPMMNTMMPHMQNMMVSEINTSPVSTYISLPSQETLGSAMVLSHTSVSSAITSNPVGISAHGNSVYIPPVHLFHRPSSFPCPPAEKYSAQHQIYRPHSLHNSHQSMNNQYFTHGQSRGLQDARPAPSGSRDHFPSTHAAASGTDSRNPLYGRQDPNFNPSWL